MISVSDSQFIRIIHESKHVTFELIVLCDILEMDAKGNNCCEVALDEANTLFDTRVENNENCEKPSGN